MGPLEFEVSEESEGSEELVVYVVAVEEIVVAAPAGVVGVDFVGSVDLVVG